MHVVVYQSYTELFFHFLFTHRDSDNSQPDHSTFPVKHERKFVVFESCLFKLFSTCPVCTSTADACIIEISGSAVIIKQTCTDDSCKFVRIWTSQPYVNQMPAGNLLLSTCVLLSGTDL